MTWILLQTSWRIRQWKKLVNRSTFVKLMSECVLAHFLLRQGVNPNQIYISTAAEEDNIYCWRSGRSYNTDNVYKTYENQMNWAAFKKLIRWSIVSPLLPVCVLYRRWCIVPRADTGRLRLPMAHTTDRTIDPCDQPTHDRDPPSIHWIFRFE